MRNAIQKVAIYKDEDRITWLAYIAEQLARNFHHVPVLSFEAWNSRHRKNHFDFCDEKLSALVEVKICSSKDSPLIFDDQLTHQLEELCASFPQKKGILLFFIYQNSKRVGPRRADKKVRLLKRGSGKSSLSLLRFLRDNLRALYVIDFGLLHALREEYGTKPYRRNTFHPRKLLNVNKTTFKNVAAYTAQSLSELGFKNETLARWLPPNARRVLPRMVTTRFSRYNISFPLIPLLSIADRRAFLRRMNGAVRREKE